MAIKYRTNASIYLNYYLVTLHENKSGPSFLLTALYFHSMKRYSIIDLISILLMHIPQLHKLLKILNKPQFLLQWDTGKYSGLWSCIFNSSYNWVMSLPTTNYHLAMALYTSFHFWILPKTSVNYSGCWHHSFL